MGKFTTKLSLDVIGDQAYEVTKPLVWEDSELVIQVSDVLHDSRKHVHGLTFKQKDIHE